ncbi:MAG: hypothetical protein JRH20_09510 [Deltaproteobacteria bacterium]|nr:hypothetical protein [Deltaproteobacteria bacterium]
MLHKGVLTRLALLIIMAPALGGCLEDTLSPIRSSALQDAAMADMSGEPLRNDSQQPLSCATKADCPEAFACELGLAGCVERRCGLPTGAEGSGEQEEGCEPGECSAGLTCVSTTLAIREERLQIGIAGTCLLACDPCTPACPVGVACIQLPTGGGYCAHEGLADEGEACAGRGCQGKMGCSGVCKRVCEPEGLVAMGSATSSSDCLAGELCIYRGASTLNGNTFFCEVGETVEDGFACDGFHRLFCKGPTRCEQPLDLCQRRCSEGCAPNTRCSTVWVLSMAKVICVGDGAVPFGGLCGEDANCREGLACVGEDVDKRCLLPMP